MTANEPGEVDLSVIVPCHNVQDTLAEALDALASQHWDGRWEVIVVNNRSDDGTASIVAERIASDPRLRLVEASDGAGVAYARNFGVACARGRWLLFCDGDDVVHPGWIAALAAGLEKYPLVTGALDVSSLNTPALAASRGPGDVMPTFYGVFDAVSGCNMGVRRDAFDRIRGFDGSFPSTEDKKFALDAAVLGMQVGWVPDAVVSYRYRTDTASLWRQGVAYGVGRVQVAAHLRSISWPGPPWLVGGKSWLWLLLHLPDVLRAERRGSWLWVAANRLGHLRGSVRYRRLCL